MRSGFIAIALGIVVGCSSADIDRGKCGNGIVEAGEDCDSTDERCNACSITCAATSDCVAYDSSGGTAGFVCGSDALCHAPSGTFINGGIIPIDVAVKSYRVTDVNHDGIGDVLAQLPNEVRVLFGDSAATGGTTASIQIPSAQGPAFYADIDQDTTLDMLMPTTDGIVAYTSPFGLPSPFPFPSPIGNEIGKPLAVQLAFSNQDLGALGIDQTDPSLPLSYAVLNVAAPIVERRVNLPLCGGGLVESDLRSTTDVDILNRQEGHQSVAVSILGTTPSRLCVVSVDRRADGNYDIEGTELFSVRPTSRPLLADIRGTGCPSLIVAQGGQIVEIPPKQSATGCTFVDTALTMFDGPLGIAPAGAIAMNPQIGGSKLVIVLSDGVYAFNPLDGRLVRVFPASRQLVSAAGADINSDGRTDIIASAAGQDSFDVLYRLPSGAFVTQLISTTSPIVKFLIGDFDGDQHPDVAYVEQSATEQRLSIAYNQTDHLLPGVTVGTFAKILTLISGDVPDSTDLANVINDLAVLYETGGVRQLALLHGSAQDTMLAFFDPRPQDQRRASRFRGVVAGSFVDSSGGNDVLAVEQNFDPASPLAGTNLWLSPGAIGGELAMGIPPIGADGIQQCNPLSEQPQPPFCIDNARYLPWPVAGRDLVLGFDSNLDVMMLDPSMNAGGDATLTRYPGALKATPGSAVRSVQTVKAADGTPRLVVSLGGSSHQIGGVDVCTFDVTTGPSCIELGESIATQIPGTWTCVDAAPAVVAATSRFSPPQDTGPDLVVLCHGPAGPDFLFRVAVDGSRAEPLLAVAPSEALQMGDVTGDGVDDVIVVDSMGFMRLFRQCTSRDVTGCRGGLQ